MTPNLLILRIFENKAHLSFLDLFPKSVVPTHLVRIRKGALEQVQPRVLIIQLMERG